MVKITEITMIMSAISGQGIDLNDKIKALILVHSMSQAWDQAPVNILSSITMDQLGPDTVIPRMKEGKKSVEIEGAEVVNFTQINDIPEETQQFYYEQDHYHVSVEMPNAANDFNITAIEINQEPSPEHSPAAPAPVENVYTNNLGTFLGSHIIRDTQSYDPDLTTRDVDMAMEHVGHSTNYPIDGSTSKLAEWYTDAISFSFVDAVDPIESLSGFTPMETHAMGE
ncbi:hypothetical protein BKA82DRAFT_34915 [Pisolithus tinctorius]|uniref:Uncharacterized protein n=1 Tax=Pisolithus tinctorius Marx 270 TaxID=870435 RepID=A0A0C3NFM4_PISTI|nr:hypothetical protein BKA82DRAFT_34915 [Pisolithus tinctorius]KIN94575.1 hypothetical protein M404DRAFT_34915 [Pisolithus tinctorius Marx 270]